MPRDSGGTYTLVSGNPVISGTVIASTWANTTMDDIAAEMTDSLSRSGNGGMQAPLKLTQGTETAPSLTFGPDPLSGLYLGAVSEVRMAANATDQMRWINNQTEIWNEVDQEWYAVVSTRDNVADVETQTLIAGQTEVTFVNNVAGAAIFINGVNADNGRLVSGVDYTYDSGAQILTLTESRPAGTLVTAQRAGGFDPETAVTPVLYDTEAALAAADIPVGTWATTKGQTVAGDGLGADWLITPAQALVGRDLSIANGNIAVFQTNIVTKSGRKNLLFNPSMEIWQRGTNFTAGAEYFVDRYFLPSIRTAIQSTDVPTGLKNLPTYSAQVTGTSGSQPAIVASVELPATGSEGIFTQNTLFTLSFWVKGTIGSDIELRVQFVTAINGAAEGVILPFTIIDTGTGAWQKVEYTFDIGATTAGATATAVELFIIVRDADTVANFTQIQLEQGSVATEFEYRPIAEELALCQRYYQKSYRQPTDIGTALTTNAVSFINGSDSTGAVGQVSVDLLVTMRGIPTVNIYSADLGTVGLIDLVQADGGIPSHPSGSASQIGDSRFRLVFTSNISSGVRFHYTADAEL